MQRNAETEPLAEAEAVMREADALEVPLALLVGAATLLDACTVGGDVRLRNVAGVLEGAGSVCLGGLEVAVRKRGGRKHSVAQPEANLFQTIVLVESPARRNVS
jgi:hypothetical protein